MPRVQTPRNLKIAVVALTIALALAVGFIVGQKSNEVSSEDFTKDFMCAAIAFYDTSDIEDEVKERYPELDEDFLEYFGSGSDGEDPTIDQILREIRCREKEESTPEQDAKRKARAQDRAAQSNLRNALTAAKVIYADLEDYSEATRSALEAVEPSLSFTDEVSSNKSTISFFSDAQAMAMAVKSESGECYSIIDRTTGLEAGTMYGTGECDAAAVFANPPENYSWDESDFRSGESTI